MNNCSYTVILHPLMNERLFIQLGVKPRYSVPRKILCVLTIGFGVALVYSDRENNPPCA
jgi:hypothetical protein